MRGIGLSLIYDSPILLLVHIPNYAFLRNNKRIKHKSGTQMKPLYKSVALTKPQHISLGIHEL